MNEIQIFSNPQFGEIRITISEDDKPMFCLADVCKALELKNPSDVKTRLSSKGVAITDTLTAGGVQSMTYINEANLYKCIFQSRKPPKYSDCHSDATPFSRNSAKAAYSSRARTSRNRNTATPIISAWWSEAQLKPPKV